MFKFAGIISNLLIYPCRFDFCLRGVELSARLEREDMEEEEVERRDRKMRGGGGGGQRRKTGQGRQKRGRKGAGEWRRGDKALGTDRGMNNLSTLLMDRLGEK